MNTMREKLKKVGYVSQAEALEKKEAQEHERRMTEEREERRKIVELANETKKAVALFGLMTEGSPRTVPDFTVLDDEDLTYQDVIGLTKYFLSDPYGRKTLVAFFRYLIDRFQPFFGKAFLGWYFTPPKKRREFRLDIKGHPDQLHLCLMGLLMVTAAEVEDLIDYDQFYFHLTLAKNPETKWMARRMFANARTEAFQNTYYRVLREESNDLAETFLEKITTGMREALKAAPQGGA